MAQELTIGGHRIAISNPKKILFPEDGFTKRDLIDYYVRIADWMIPLMRGRPLTMHRFPDGIGGKSFYQQDISDYFPDWIHRIRVEKQDGGEVVHVVCDNAATLCYLANQACITPHVWLSRSDQPRRPDQVIFDLDPSNGDFRSAAGIALHFKDLLEEIGMGGFVKTTGANGLHLIVPLIRTADFTETRAFAHAAAGLLARRFPREATTEIRLDKRAGRVYVDVLRNSYGQTAVAPYAVRAIAGAPVATPLDWSELRQRGLTAQKYTVRNIFTRLEKNKDPWAEMKGKSYSLKRAKLLLEKMEEGDPQGAGEMREKREKREKR